MVPVALFNAPALLIVNDDRGGVAGRVVGDFARSHAALVERTPVHGVQVLTEVHANASVLVVPEVGHVILWVEMVAGDESGFNKYTEVLVEEVKTRSRDQQRDEHFGRML